MNGKSRKLPNKPSELITVALDDLSDAHAGAPVTKVGHMKGPIIHIAGSMTVWPREALEVRALCGVQGMLIGTWRQHEVNEARKRLGTGSPDQHLRVKP